MFNENLMVWNKEWLKDGPGADDGYVRDMTAIFVRQADNLLYDVRLASDESDRKRAVHAYKGAAAAVGAERAAGFCRQLENLAYVGQETWEELVDNLQKEADKMIEEFNTWLSTRAA